MDDFENHLKNSTFFLFMFNLYSANLVIFLALKIVKKSFLCSGHPTIFSRCDSKHVRLLFDVKNSNWKMLPWWTINLHVTFLYLINKDLLFLSNVFQKNRHTFLSVWSNISTLTRSSSPSGTYLISILKQILSGTSS